VGLFYHSGTLSELSNRTDRNREIMARIDAYISFACRKRDLLYHL
jgi:hypothetical protein